MSLLDVRPATPGPADRLVHELSGLDLWHADRHAAEEALSAPGLTREDRLDAARRLDVVLREQEVLDACLARQLEQDQALHVRTAPRAVVAHRHAWTTSRLTAAFADAGIEVLAVLDNGADVVGTCLAESPDVVVLEDLLAMRTGAETAALLRRYVPTTVVGGLVASERSVGTMLDAGAQVVMTRRVPPQDLVLALRRLVAPVNLGT